MSNIPTFFSRRTHFVSEDALRFWLERAFPSQVEMVRIGKEKARFEEPRRGDHYLTRNYRHVSTTMLTWPRIERGRSFGSHLPSRLLVAIFEPFRGLIPVELDHHLIDFALGNPYHTSEAIHMDSHLRCTLNVHRKDGIHICNRYVRERFCPELFLQGLVRLGLPSPSEEEMQDDQVLFMGTPLTAHQRLEWSQQAHDLSHEWQTHKAQMRGATYA